MLATERRAERYATPDARVNRREAAVVMRQDRAERLLRVDLSTGAMGVNELEDLDVRLYAGGSLLATRLLLSETPAGLEAFDPAALLVVASSAVAGQRAPALPRFAIAGKSPLTGGIGEARAEGPFGVALRQSGFLAIVLSGRAAEPVALAIVDGKAALLSARDLWGLDTSEVVDAMETRLGRPCHVAAIGPAGETLVRYASVVSDRSFAAARTGLGAVMGSKRLKAIAISGAADSMDGSPGVADPARLEWLSARYRGLVDVNPVTRWQREPPGFGAWVGGASAGTYAVENYRTSRPAGGRAWSGEEFLPFMAWGSDGCPGCPSDCVKGFAPSSDVGGLARTRDRREGGLHQEAVAALGPNLGLTELARVLALNDRCLRLGLDPVSLGFTLSFAMECRESDLLSAGDLGGVDLRFGGADDVGAAIEQIASRTGPGEWLADGAARAAQHLGPVSQPFALTVKGLEMSVFDPRAQAGLALGFATAPFGPRYDVAEHDADYDDTRPSWPHSLELSRTLGIHELLPATAQTAEKTRIFATLVEFWSALDALLVCPYASAPVRILSLEDVAELVGAITGWDTSAYEVMRWGARRLQLMRIYNLREGLTAADDRLPDRFFDEPIDDGPLAGAKLDRAAFAAMIATYYELMGWDEAGAPTAATRLAHQLEWTLAAQSLSAPDTATGETRAL
jgi:aldehyde:ferredoxin oxidoreductase